MVFWDHGTGTAELCCGATVFPGDKGPFEASLPFTHRTLTHRGVLWTLWQLLKKASPTLTGAVLPHSPVTLSQE